METKQNTFKHYLFFLFACISLSFSTQAQTGSLTGVVSSNKEPKLFSASIALFNEKNTLTKAVLSDADGKFTIQRLAAGTYSLKITMVGYEDKIVPGITITDNQINLGTLTLNESAVQLNEVVVKKEKPLVQVLADKTVFNVENTINATGNTGFELLRKAPGVVVDNNDNVIVEGKSGVLFYIDGKQSFLSGSDLTNYLKTIQSADIESIEIITQPSSKFDAAGNAGIVNIKLKRNKNYGTNGTASAGYNYGRYGTSVNSVSLNNRSKKINSYINYSNRFGKSYNFMEFERQQNGKVFNSDTKTDYTSNANNVKIGLDFTKNRRNTFGLVVTGNFNNAYGDGRSRTPIRQITSNSIDSILVAQNKAHNKNYNLYANLNYRFQDTTGVSFSTDLDVGRFNSDRNTFLPNYYYNPSETVILSSIINSQYTPVTIDVGSLKSDYEQRLWKGKLGAGFKSSLVETENTFDVYNYQAGQPVYNTTLSNRFNYKENINALYVNFNRLYKKFNFQLGLRMENTNSDGNLTSSQANNAARVRRHYTDLFPSGGLTYNQNENNSWALTYSRRIERPSYNSLNPFEYQIDELSVSKGNPFLQPQYVHNIKFSHTYKYKLNTSLSYSYVSDFFAQVTEAVGQNKSRMTTKNVANQETINLGISYPFTVKNWWNVYLSVNAFRSKYIPTDPSFTGITQETLNIYGQNNFKLPKGINLEVSGWFNSPSVWGGTYRTASLGSLDMAVQKKFLKDKLTARLAVSDIFYTSPWTGKTEFANVIINGRGGSDSRQVRFSVTYNFGNDQVKKAQTRSTGVEDEKNRIGG
ncbi:MAG: hypothetical protein RLZZ500_807 [Bacteroidota bacterium]|jgi:hypothetical protein